MTENWYLILELEFDPNPVQDPGKIEDKINEMQKFWSRNANHMTKGAEYRRYMQMIPAIREAMSNLDERKRMIEEACAITYANVDRLLKLFHKSEITNDEVTKTATKLKVSTDIVNRRAVTLGIKVVAAKTADYQAAYDKHYKTQPQDAHRFSGMEPLLKTFSVDNLYSFLFLNTQIKNANNLPCDTLRQRASEKKKAEFFRPNDDIHSSGRKLCDHCELTFKDDDAKVIYDRYIEYTKRKTIFSSVKTIAEISGKLSSAQGEEFIGQLTELFKDRKLSTEVLLAFCEIEKIAYNPTTGFTQPSTNLKVCHCGCTNDVSDGRKACQSCGTDLYIKCPKCSTVNDANIKVCKCGFNLENINKSIALCDLAEHAINTMDFSLAQAHIENAKRYWPGYEKIKSLAGHLNDRQNQAGATVNLMRKTVSEKRYYEAKRHFQKVRKLFSDFSEPALEEEITIAITTAGQYLKQAQAAKNEIDVIDFCLKAYEVCTDYPGIKELVFNYPPQSPTNLKVSIDRNSRTNNLTWDKSSTVGLVYYSVLRKINAVPVNVSDGELLGRVSMCGFNDNKIEPAENYFYAVFAERAGVYSNALASKSPSLNLFEISNVTIVAGDSLLQLEWSALPRGAMVEINRKIDLVKEEKITSTTSGSYLDSGLTNDRPYHYTIKLAYNVNGQRQLTNGISITGIPTKPPKAIDSLRIKPSDGNTYTAVWSNPDNVIVELYCSNKRPEYSFGDLISQTVLEAKMQRLALNRISSTSAAFQYTVNDLLYIAAVVIKSGSVIFGAVSRVSKGETVKINQISAVNEKIHIYIDVPRGVTGFVVLHRFDKFPEDISDVQATRKYFPLKLYQHYSALVLDTLEPKYYYFSVFAEHTRDGEKDYSVGSDYLFSNVSKNVITYSIAVEKIIFGNSSVLLEFKAETNSFILPDLEVMSSTGKVPMFKTSANHFHTIPSQTVNGSVQIKIPLPKGLPHDTYIKAFLKDGSFASTNQLKLKLKSNYKIS